VEGWLVNGGAGTPDNTNTDKLVSIAERANGSIGPDYVRDYKSYKCPNDKSLDGGGYGARVRTISMNGWMNAGRGVGTVSTVNGWEKIFTREADIRSPSDMFVTVDERIGSINDGWFAVAVNGWTSPDPASIIPNLANVGITDWPANYHNKASSFSFSDGHTEIHKWTNPATYPLQEPGAGFQTLANNMDMVWLMTHSTQ